VDREESAPEPVQAPPRRVSRRAVLAALVIGAIIGGMAVEYWLTRTVSTPDAQTSAAPAADVAADIAYLKSVLPTQSHTMTSVGYHWANLWFAAEKKNWPLARFFFDESRSHMRWTILIRPVRQLPGGGTVDVKGLFTAFDMSAMATVQLAIEDQNHAEFVTAYKQALDGCHSCHTASAMPYLRPVVPAVPPSTVISFDPAAKGSE
jgi:hypothetical protein